MSKPSKAKPPDDPVQSARFIQTANEHEASEQSDAFDAVMDAITTVKKPQKPPARPKAKKVR